VNTKKISARSQFGKDWISVLQKFNVDRIEILRHSEKDGTLIPYDYSLTQIDYPGANNRFTKGELIAIYPANSEYQPILKITGSGMITAHAFNNNVPAEYIIKKEKEKPATQKVVKQPPTVKNSIHKITKPTLAPVLLKYAGMAAMLTGAVLIFSTFNL